MGSQYNQTMNTKKIEALILDMDGVLWKNKEPIGDLEASFRLIQVKGYKYVFATNNSTKSVNDYLSILSDLGIPVISSQIFTSAKATAQMLKSRHPMGGNVFVVGMEGLETTLAEFGFANSLDSALAVVVGMDFTLTYEKLRIATLFIRKGIPFIGTNPDKTFPSPEGQIPGAGSMLAALEASTGIKPEIVGKPNATMFVQALESLNLPPEKVMVVGDRLETDIAGGQAANCHTALVLSGVSSYQQGQTWVPRVDYIFNDFQSLVEWLP